MEEKKMNEGDEYNKDDEDRGSEHETDEDVFL